MATNRKQKAVGPSGKQVIENASKVAGDLLETIQRLQREDPIKNKELIKKLNESLWEC